jgi:hypothetical protein
MKGLVKALASIRLTTWLLTASVAVLLLGSFYVQADRKLFTPLNNGLLPDWFRETVAKAPGEVWWFPLLVITLTLLGINNAACILDRLSLHWRLRAATGNRVFFHRIIPSLVHACFGFILLGHLLSVAAGYRLVAPVAAGQTTSLPGGAEMQFADTRCEFYAAPFAGQLRDCVVPVKLSVGGEVDDGELAVGRPLYWHGFQAHLSTVGSAQPGHTPALQVIVKRDPGSRVIISCFPIMILLLLIYYGFAPATKSNGNGIPLSASS